MNLQQKQLVTATANAYLALHSINASELVRVTKVNASYVSNILNGKYTADANGKEVAIKDQHFYKIAEVVGADVQPSYWKMVPTAQMLELIAALERAKGTSMAATLICPTGMGKTTAMELFHKKEPKHTYIYTVHSLVKVHDIINWLVKELKLPENTSRAMKLTNIIMKLRDLKRAGGDPVIILDEMENAPMPVVKFVKGLFDGLKHGQSRYGSLVLLGTDQLKRKMERLKNSNKEAGPQFYRRFKAGLREINDTVDFTPFFETFIPGETGLQKLLGNICDNYGELNSYLEPAIREAYEKEQPLTEHFFRVFHDMRKI